MAGGCHDFELEERRESPVEHVPAVRKVSAAAAALAAAALAAAALAALAAACAAAPVAPSTAVVRPLSLLRPTLFGATAKV